MRSTTPSFALGAAVGLLLPAFTSTGDALAQTRLQKTFDQWMVECVETDKKICGLSFRLVNTKNNRTVLSWAVVPAKDAGGNLAVIRTPNGVSLADGVSVKVGNAEPVKISYKTCGPVNCIGEADFSDAWLKAFRASESFTLTYVGNNGKKFSQDISLKGFADGFSYYVEQSSTSSNE